MSFSTLQLASTSALALLAGSAEAPQGHSNVLDEFALLREGPCATSSWISRTSRGCGVSAGEDLAPHRMALNLHWETKRTASDVLTELLDVDGVRVVAERHLWDRPDVLALRHDFASDAPFHLHCTAGIDRAVYVESRTVSPYSALSVRRRNAAGVMAEVGTSWRVTGQLNVETDIRWAGMDQGARLVRPDGASIAGNPVALTLSLVWRGK